MKERLDSSLFGELLKLQTGLALTHVPYKGTGPALNDLIGQGVCSFSSHSCAAGRTTSSCPGSASSNPRWVPSHTESPVGKTARTGSATPSPAV